MRWQHWINTVPLRLRSLLRRDEVERELEEEMRYHLERRLEEYVASGLSPEEARHAAMRAMEGIEQQKEKCRDMRKINSWKIFGRICARAPECCGEVRDSPPS